jgi:hypothetical protein
MLLSRREIVHSIMSSPLLLQSSSSKVRAAGPFDPARTVEHLARVTREEYHDARLAAAIADRLIAGMRSGGFASGNPAQFADRLNGEIAAASGDDHFVVMAGEMADMRPVPPTEPHSETLPLNDRERTFLKAQNFGFAVAEVLPGNVGRLAVREQFYRPAPEVRQRLAAAMSFLADTAALIVDLRKTIGGDPKSVALALSYFFEGAPFVVNRFRWRKLPTQEFSTSADPGGPRYGARRPVAVLVSKSSFSAAEEFAYDMKVLRRGIIVGENTPGAANHALPVALEGGFTAFIPKARAENPLTGTNWEGVGVDPDVPASPPTVTAAHRVLLKRLISASDRATAAAARRALDQPNDPASLNDQH